MLVADDAAALREPFQVQQAGQVVPDPQNKDHDQRQHECPRHVVVHPFATNRDCREDLFAQDWQDPVLAIEQVQT